MQSLFKFLFIVPFVTVEALAEERPVDVVIPHSIALEYHKAILNKTFSNKPYSFVSAPMMRAASNFKLGKYNCFLGGDIPTIKKYYGIDVIQSDSVFQWGIGVYTSVDSPVVKNLKELEGKTGVMMRGNDFVGDPKNTYKLKQIHYVTEDEQIARMIAAGRVEIGLYWYPKLKTNRQIHRHSGLSLFEANERLVCHPSEENKKLIEVFNRSLKKLDASGWLKESFNLKYEH